MKRVRIGNGCGFWGDNIDAPIQLAQQGRLDYLTLEYLAELTMSILAKLKQRDPDAGFATDFIDLLDRLGPTLVQNPNLKIITNAGGMNPQACAQQTQEVLTRHGFADRSVGIVSGDDLMPRLDELIEAGHSLNHLDTGEPIHAIRQRIVSANAYLGAKPIADALSAGASIVVTGRVADAALTLGPLAHEFGWGWQSSDIDRLAAGITAGHLIECGAQVTGGLWCNADESTNLANVGYPIVEFTEDGTFTISKPPNTGGSVNFETVAEQLLYEVADPAWYYTPDVIADFTTPQLTETQADLVEVKKCSGREATDTYKVSIAYRDGFTAAGTLVIAGPNAVAKARQSAAILLERLRLTGCAFAEHLIETIGAGASVPGALPEGDPPEVMLRVAVRDGNRASVERFAKEFRAAGHLRLAGHHRLHLGPTPCPRGLQLLAGLNCEKRD